MPGKFSRILRHPFHPLLVNIYPVLAIYLFNVNETPLFALVRSFLFSIATGLACYLFFLLLFIPWRSLLSRKTLLGMAVLSLVLGLGYTLVYGYINPLWPAIAKHRYLIPLWLTLYFAGLISVVDKESLSRIFSMAIVWEKAAAAASLFLILFYSYGHVFNTFLFDPGSGRKAIFARYQELIIAWLSILVFGLVLVAVSKKLETQTRALNAASVFLVLGIMIQLGFYFLPALFNPRNGPELNAQNIPHSSQTPDVYYIVLDAYSRQDVLLQYGFDNSGFIAQLEELGFMVPGCSSSNYSYTLFSMASTLNMDYLENLDIPSYGRDINYGHFTSLIHHSAVRQIFEDLGYSTVTLKVINPYLDITDSTYYFNPESDSSNLNKIETIRFHYLFLQTTALRPYLDYLEWRPKALEALPPMAQNWFPVGNAFSGRNYKQYQLSLYNLSTLGSVPDLPAGKFVYAHLIVTHEPFVFTPDGQFRYPVTGDDEGYIDQVRFANERMIEILKKIITDSAVPPIVVIQGDHGYPWGPSRNKNLSAFYLPGADRELIHPEITNVNTFRLIFNEYFAGNYELLPDVSHVSAQGDPYDMETFSFFCENN